MERSSKNPVSPEEIVGISEDMGAKSALRLRVPREVLEAFRGEFRPEESKIVTPSRLFVSRRLISSGETTREYYRFSQYHAKQGSCREDMSLSSFLCEVDGFEERGYSEDDSSEFLKLSLAHRLRILDGRFKIFHADINDLATARNFRHTKVGLSRWINDRGREILKFTRVFNDQQVEVFWDEVGCLKMIYSMPTARPPVGGISPTWYMSFEGKKPYIWSFELDRDKTRLRPVMGFHLQGRNMQVTIDDDNVNVTFERSRLPGVVDYRLGIPRRQEMKTIINRQGEKVRRFVFEENLIPEPLRENPFQEASELDDIWIRTDLTTILGVRLVKNNPDPVSLQTQ